MSVCRSCVSDAQTHNESLISAPSPLNSRITEKARSQRWEDITHTVVPIRKVRRLSVAELEIDSPESWSSNTRDRQKQRSVCTGDTRPIAPPISRLAPLRTELVDAAVYRFRPLVNGLVHRLLCLGYGYGKVLIDVAAALEESALSLHQPRLTQGR